MPKPSRRTVALGLTAAAIASPAYIRPAWAQGKRLVICHFGGIEYFAKRQVLYDPFTKATGIEIITTTGPDIAKMKVQVEHRNVEWDVTEMNDAWLPTAAAQGLLERIDLSIVNRVNCVPQAMHDFAVGRAIYGAGIAFPTNRLQGKVPATWRDFWDTKAFPGRRGLRNRITDTLEIALMADGVPASQVYPCDVERAFRALERIKPHVSQWIAQSQQAVSLIQRDETDFTLSYATRVKKSREANIPIGYSFRQNILGVNFSGVLRGTKNRDAAMRFLAFTMDRDRQVKLANLTIDSPSRTDALPLVDPRVRGWLPNIGNPENLFTNPAWWNGRVDELNTRFKEWLLT